MQIVTIAASSFDVKNIIIDSNIFESEVNLVFGVGGGMPDYARPFKDIKITNNIFKNIRSAIKFTGVFENLDISQNTFDMSDFLEGTAVQLALEPSATETGGVTQAASKILGVKVNPNSIFHYAVGIDISFSGYTGAKSKALQIIGNHIKNRPTTPGQGIMTNSFTPLVQSNIIENVSLALYLRSNPVAYAFDNLIYDATTAIDSSSITSFVKDRNYDDDVLIP